MGYQLGELCGGRAAVMLAPGVQCPGPERRRSGHERLATAMTVHLILFWIYPVTRTGLLMSNLVHDLQVYEKSMRFDP